MNLLVDSKAFSFSMDAEGNIAITSGTLDPKFSETEEGMFVINASAICLE